MISKKCQVISVIRNFKQFHKYNFMFRSWNLMEKEISPTKEKFRTFLTLRRSFFFNDKLSFKA